ncbi:MAG: hypothetical protein JXR34_02820, partial [Bacteroidales bacterium]|nr:hypothetical protein [Bacteroidales bacterium]
FNDIWIDSTYYKISPYKQNPDLSFSQTWEKGDTIYIRTSKRTFPDEGKIVKDFNGENKVLPKTYEGAALIGYSFKGKQRHHVVKQINQLPKEYHP